MLNRPRLWLLMWLILCVGLLANHFVNFPWSGLNVDVGDVSISANREWAAGGIPRLSGFSRTSYDGASTILILFIYLMSTWYSRAVRLVLIVASAVAIALTTSKGAAAAFLVIVVLYPLLRWTNSPKSIVKQAVIGLLLAIAVTGMILPLMSEQIQFPRLQVGTPEFWLFSSFVDRAWVTWPRAFALLTTHWQWLTGRGMGGIGAAQNLFEPSVYSPGDNLFIYLYTTAGLAGAFLYCYIALASRKLSLGLMPHRAALLLALASFVYGLTVNVIENATFALSLGAVTCLLAGLRDERTAPEAVLHDIPRSTIDFSKGAIIRRRTCRSFQTGPA